MGDRIRGNTVPRRCVRLLIVALALLVLALPPVRRYAGWAWRRAVGGYSIAQRLDQYGPAVRKRLGESFRRAGLPYPPREVALIGIKDRKVLEVWARGDAGPFVWVRDYPILAASGQLGPKLRQGDRQVPEGLYRVESLHPNSLFHLALRVNYPNDFDRRQAATDGRADLGGNIMIHGSNGSVGCLAMGDAAAEDLFVLVADTGLDRTRLILTPVDFRTTALPPDTPALPAWTQELYDDIRASLIPFRR